MSMSCGFEHSVLGFFFIEGFFFPIPCVYLELENCYVMTTHDVRVFVQNILL